MLTDQNGNASRSVAGTGVARCDIGVLEAPLTMPMPSWVPDSSWPAAGGSAPLAAPLPVQLLMGLGGLALAVAVSRRR